MSNQRAARVGDQMREELAKLIRGEMKDPRIGFVSIVKVEVSGDLRHAKVYVSVLGTPEEQKASMKGLQSATGFLRSHLGQALRLRHVPELIFTLDNSIAHGTRIAELLVQVRREQEEKGE